MFAAVALILSATHALADPRIRTLPYDPDRVTVLKGYLGYQLMIEFADDERIENVSIGDSLGWQITPNKKATLLFLKPMAKSPATNMTVVTDHRRYTFDLAVAAGRARRAAEMAYVIRFAYPPVPAPTIAAPEPPEAPVMRNRAYSYTGSRASLPALVFDDGHFTYFRWPEDAATPAIFIVAADGTESLVDYSVRDGFEVIEQTAPRFALRNGKDVTFVVNDGWRAPSAGDLAPRPHDRKTAREAARRQEGAP